MADSAPLFRKVEGLKTDHKADARHTRVASGLLNREYRQDDLSFDTFLPVVEPSEETFPLEMGTKWALVGIAESSTPMDLA